ncbi:hypothetical protein PSTG_20079, partial [Puccinia striiformis f. sp. tritici PST-78]
YNQNYPYLLITDNERVFLTKDSYIRHVTTTAIKRLKEEAAKRPSPASHPKGSTGRSNNQKKEWYENLAPNPVLGTRKTADKSSGYQAELHGSRIGSGRKKRVTYTPMKEIQNASNLRPIEPRDTLSTHTWIFLPVDGPNICYTTRTQSGHLTC